MEPSQLGPPEGSSQLNNASIGVPSPTQEASTEHRLAELNHDCSPIDEFLFPRAISPHRESVRPNCESANTPQDKDWNEVQPVLPSGALATDQGSPEDTIGILADVESMGVQSSKVAHSAIEAFDSDKKVSVDVDVQELP